jgi:type IV secretory pathway VirJ component
MPRILGAALAGALLLLCLPAAHQAHGLEVDGGTLGRLQLVTPAGEARAVVFLISGEAGRTAELDRAAERLAELGAIVAPVDLPAFLARQSALDRECL